MSKLRGMAARIATLSVALLVAACAASVTLASMSSATRGTESTIFSPCTSAATSPAAISPRSGLLGVAGARFSASQDL